MQKNKQLHRDHQTQHPQITDIKSPQHESEITVKSEIEDINPKMQFTKSQQLDLRNCKLAGRTIWRASQ